MKQVSRRYYVLFRLGMLVFRLTALLTCLMPFTRLSLEKRRGLVERWAYGSWALPRQLFRPVRSIALLAFYEFMDLPGDSVDGEKV